jgi:hypothetical protein
LIIREHNVWLIRKDKKDIQLTRKGTEEDFFLNEFRYSPNKRYALGFQSTRVIPRKIPILRSSPKDQVQPTIEFINYPKPAIPVLNVALSSLTCKKSPHSGRRISIP